MHFRAFGFKARNGVLCEPNDHHLGGVKLAGCRKACLRSRRVVHPHPGMRERKVVSQTPL
jgi:hypothetical protein